MPLLYLHPEDVESVDNCATQSTRTVLLRSVVFTASEDAAADGPGYSANCSMNDSVEATATSEEGADSKSCSIRVVMSDVGDISSISSTLSIIT